MAEKFIVVWTIDGETMNMSHSTQNEALRLAENLLREHGCDLEIALHLDPTPQPASVWFNKKRMRDWCLAGEHDHLHLCRLRLAAMAAPTRSLVAIAEGSILPLRIFSVGSTADSGTKKNFARRRPKQLSLEAQQ